MSFEDEDTQLLTEIGFTKTQAKMYLTLLKLGRTDGKTLAKRANASRPVVYRTLDELQKMGLVEKEIALPYKFEATPLKQGLQILMTQKFQHYEEDREKTEEFLLRKHSGLEEKLEEQEYQFRIVEGRERILQIIKHQHDNAHKSVDILTTLQRWLTILDFCFENYEKALERNVKYRIVIGESERKVVLPDKVRVLMRNPTSKVKLSRYSLKNNLGIFDGNEATFNFFPSRRLKESPIIWTNHPSFISMAQDHFEHVWKSARKFEMAELE